jgi:CHAT domain-containing protein
MVMSLWNVSDRVGTEFMNIFYEKLLDKENRQDKRKAFEKAKMAIRKKYPDPYYWACFVMMDWINSKSWLLSRNLWHKQILNIKNVI